MIDAGVLSMEEVRKQVQKALSNQDVAPPEDVSSHRERLESQLDA